MTISKQQIEILVGLITSTEADGMNCDECFGQIGEFAEYAIEGREIPEAMQAITRHLEQCPCCKGEYEALLEALKELEEV